MSYFKKIIPICSALLVIISGCSAELVPNKPQDNKPIKTEISALSTSSISTDTIITTVYSSTSQESTSDDTDSNIFSTEPVTQTNTSESQQSTAAPNQTDDEYEPVFTDIDPDFKDRLEGYFTDTQRAYLRSCAFAGDSIIHAPALYGFISKKRCYATAGAAARNIYDWSFEIKGKEYGIIDALKHSGCQSFYFLMGMNDVRITSADIYYDNYKSFLEDVRENCPYADINVISVTPITEECGFYPNEKIDALNVKLKQLTEESGGKITYIDVAGFLKDEKGALKLEYAVDDGIHMQIDVYYDIFRIILQQKGVA